MPFSLNTLHEFVDWFVPAELAADREMRKQARLFLISHLLGPFLGNVVPIALYVLDPDPGFEVAVLGDLDYQLLDLPAAPARLGALLQSHRPGLDSKPDLLHPVELLFLRRRHFADPALGPDDPAPVLLLSRLVPHSTASRAGDVRDQLCRVLRALFLRSRSGGRHSFSALQGLGLLSTAAASAYVIMMALFYARAVASQSEMAVEMRGHLKTAAELRRAATEAERASVAKADFLAKMSHELRTPLNAVIGYSQMLLEEAEDESDAESVADLERIHIAGQHLLRLVNDILDLSKIEAARWKSSTRRSSSSGWSRKRLLLSAPSRRAMATRSRSSSSPDRHHRLRCQQDTPCPVPGSGKCSQIHARRQHPCPMQPARTERGNQLLVSVRDTGVGIAPEQISGLFEQFAVADDSSSSKYGGTGLGLALSQKLCHLMGGDVTAESTLNIGSCFTIMLPAVPPPGTVDSASDALAADEVGLSAAQAGQAGDVAAPLVKTTQSGPQKVLAAANA